MECEAQLFWIFASNCKLKQERTLTTTEEKDQRCCYIDEHKYNTKEQQVKKEGKKGRRKKKLPQPHPNSKVKSSHVKSLTTNYEFANRQTKKTRKQKERQMPTAARRNSNPKNASVLKDFEMGRFHVDENDGRDGRYAWHENMIKVAEEVFGRRTVRMLLRPRGDSISLQKTAIDDEQMKFIMKLPRAPEDVLMYHSRVLVKLWLGDPKAASAFECSHRVSRRRQFIISSPGHVHYKSNSVATPTPAARNQGSSLASSERTSLPWIGRPL